MSEIKVNASKNYSVFIEKDFSFFKKEAEKIIKGQKILILTDSNVDSLYPNAFVGLFCGKQVYKFVIQAGEESKNATNFLEIINFLAKNSFTRKDTLVAFGGGVVGDLGGFVASTYMRGICFINVATTLLSAVDSSVGGKTAIDLEYGKNLVGTFYQPDMVYINVDFLKTLPSKEQANGYGEIIKYVFLSDTLTLDDFSGELSVLIEKCVKIKRDIVERDEKESGERKLLNLGHTVAHAIEKLSSFTIPHGLAVAKGLKKALEISAKYYNLDDTTVEKALKIISCKNHDLTIPYADKEILTALENDKKSTFNGVDFVLIDNTLRAKIVPLTFEELKELY